eukprot:3442744-Amphidinium_carterae.1
MWQWRDVSGKPPWHSAPKITPAHALAWWVAEHGLDLSPQDRRRLDASSAALVHCSTGDPLPPRPTVPGPGSSSAGPAHLPQAAADSAQPPSKRIRVPFRLPRKHSLRPAPLPPPAAPPSPDVAPTQVDSDSPVAQRRGKVRAARSKG